MVALTRRLRPATAAPFRQLIADAGQDIRETTAALAAGKIGPDEWHGILLETLAEAHAQAGYLGRLRAGDRAPFDEDDSRFGMLVAQEEMPFLDGFRDELAAGRYRDEDGALDAGKMERRAQLYVQRLMGTANEALALVAGDREEWIWEAEPDPCPDCARLAAHSPYPGAPPTMPGECATRCLTNCRCIAYTASGLRGFAP